MDFQRLLHNCRAIRTTYSKPFNGVPDSINFSADGKQVLFLSSGSLYSDELKAEEDDLIDDVERDFARRDPVITTSTDSPTTSPASEGIPPHQGKVNQATWKKLQTSFASRQLSRTEQLLRERMRATGSGITSYDYNVTSDLLVIHGSRCTVMRRKTEICVSEFPELPGGLDYKLCPLTPQLVGCVYEGDVWVLDAVTGNKHRMTFAAEPGSNCSAGQPSFIIQEEFDRYTGYWWQPKTKESDGVHRILFEEVDETDVEVVHTFNPSTQTVEDYKYPRPGSKNAPSKLRLLQFTIDEDRKISSSRKSLPRIFSDYFPDCNEYLVRAGWTPDGAFVWFQLLDRVQKRLKIVFIQWEAFVDETDKFPREQSEQPSETPPTEYEPFVAWEETTDVWINVGDILSFLPPLADAPLRFILSSDRSGFRHLYLVNATPPSQATPSSQSQLATSLPMATSSVVQLTSGDWVVFGSEIWLDVERSLVYFEGNCSSPLERHLYVVSYEDESQLPCENPLQLTAAGYFHNVQVDTKNNLFATTFSNASCAPTVAIYSIDNAPFAQPLHTVKEGIALPPGYIPPTFFQVKCETGETLHGMVFPPVGLEPGKQYPTILYVYGGPQIQMVTGGLSRHLPRIEVWCQHGYAVVVIDNRGSANRGLKFEGHLKDRMGLLEVEDQVTGLMHASATVDYIDLSRVAITGWSYGGYMSLMAIALRQDVFKLAISGAPVTDWMYYDTGYTERYLGVPPTAVQSYSNSSILAYVNKFPSEPNRVLIIHGMNDENVLFTHTSVLCDKLVAHGKPYQLQLYTGERHGLRSPTSALHCDATVLAFLKYHL